MNPLFTSRICDNLFTKHSTHMTYISKPLIRKYPQTLRGPMFEGWLGGHYNTMRPTVVFTIFILYRTPFSPEVNVMKQMPKQFVFLESLLSSNYPKPFNCCKTFGYFDSSRIYSCVVIFTQKTSSSQTNNCSGRYTEIVTGHETAGPVNEKGESCFLFKMS